MDQELKNQYLLTSAK